MSTNASTSGTLGLEPLPRSDYERRRAWRDQRLSAERAACLDALRSESDHTTSVAILSQTTWRPIAPFIEGECLLDRVAAEVRFFEYNALEGEIATGNDRYDTIILALDDPTSHGALYCSTARGDDASIVEETVEGVALRIEKLRGRTSQLLLVLPPLTPGGPFGAQAANSRLRAVRAALELRLAPLPEVEILDLAAVELALGHSAHDSRLWALGRIPYSPLGFAHTAEIVTAPIRRRLGVGLKAIICDLDHTLWGGVIGEDGIDGIALGEDHPGRAFRDFQRRLSEWAEAGLLLAIASKNNPEDALHAIDHHPEMILRREAFAHTEIHWQPKAVSITRILEAFNIGPEAALFIDDNPRERAAVATEHPRLRILDLPEDPLEYLHTLDSAPWPLFVATSDEDRKRLELQRQQAERHAARESSESPIDYRSSLGIQVTIRVDESTDVARVAQLHQKTNQFNANPLRLAESDIAQRMNSEDHCVVTLRYRDRYGDAGLVGCATVRFDSGSAIIETFLLSCRVIALGVEDALIAAIIDRIADRRGDRALKLLHRRTARNAPAREFLSRVTELVGDSTEEFTTLEIDARRVATPTWILVEEEMLDHA